MPKPGDELEGSGVALPDPGARAGDRLAGLGQLASVHHAALLAATLFLALVIRIGVLVDLRHTIYFRALMPDEDTYHRWAMRLASGTDGASFAPDFPKLPAIVFGAVYSVFGAETLHVRILNVILGVAVCAVAYWIGRMLYGKAAGLAAALLCAVSESLAFYSTTLLKTCLGLLLFGLVVALGLSALQQPARNAMLKILAAGALIGLLANVRANAAIVGLLVIPAAFALARRAPKATNWHAVRLIAAFVGGYVVCASASGGLAGPRFAFNLYMGNSPDNPSPYFRPVRFTSSAPEYQSTGFVVEASQRTGRKLSADEAERFWVSAVLEAAREQPARFATQLWWKALAIFHSSPADNNHDIRLVGRFVPNLRWAWLPSWLLLALGVGCASALPRDRRLATGALLFALYAATIVAFFAGERLRVPLLLLCAPYAGAGLVTLVTAPAARRRALWPRAFAIASAVSLVSLIPVPTAGDLSGPYNMHALMLFDEGDLEAAERWYRRSLSLAELDSEGARIGLAAISQRRGQLDEAVALLRPLPDWHYEAASKYEWLGTLALARRRPEEAARAFEAAIRLDQSKQNAYKGLFVAHRMLGERAEADAVNARLEYIESLR